MGSEWRSERFARMAVLVWDVVHPSGAPRLPYIGLEHIGEGTLQLLGTSVAEDATSLKARFRAGDILFGKLRPYFRKVIRAPFDGICSTDIWVVRPQPGVDAGFLFYLMASNLFIEPVVRASEGTKMPRAKWEYAANLEFPFPPLPEQRAIAHILGTLDDKIELNRRMSETLEAMARALFKAWFVDFEPVRAKMEGRWVRGQSLPGLPGTGGFGTGGFGTGGFGTGGFATRPYADLFPDRLVPSELGEIPEGWKVTLLGNVLSELVSGSRPRGGAAKEGVPSIGAENVIGLGKYDFSKEKYIPQELFEELQQKGAVVRPGDVLLYKDGAQIGRKTYFDCGFPHTECAVNEHVFILRAQHPCYQRYLFFWLDQDWMTQEIKSLNSNSAQPGINQQGVRSLPLLLPPKPVVQAFDRISGLFTDRLFATCHESRTLAALRDALLPKLIRGEIRVKDAERFLKERGL